LRGEFATTTAVVTAPPGVPTTLRVLATWIAAFAAIFGVFALAYGFHGAVTTTASLSFAGRELRPNSRDAGVEGAAIDVRGAKSGRATLLQVPLLPFQAADLGRLRVDAGLVPEGTEVAVLWVRRLEPGKIHDQRIEVNRGRAVPVMLDRNPEWRGEIAMVALGVKGPSPEPWRIERVTLEAVRPATIARAAIGDWTSFGKWNGRSINVSFGGPESQQLYLPPLAFGASLLALALLYVRQRRRGGALPAWALVLPFVVGWIVVDLRWSAELTAKAAQTWQAFAGRTLDERHLAMEDSDLYRTVSLARSQLPGTPQRIFVGSDFDVFRMRAAYYLYPHNVLPFGWYDAKAMRPGDFVFLYQKADMRFDATNHALIWPDGSKSTVTAVLAQTGAGLFRVE